MKLHLLRLPNKAGFTGRKDFIYNGIDYSFHLYTYYNQSGFVHFCKFFVDWENVSDAKAQYYNRTWEKYTGHSVYKEALKYALDTKQVNQDVYNYLKGVLENE